MKRLDEAAPCPLKKKKKLIGLLTEVAQGRVIFSALGNF